jgi:PAS domain S-box-containing protein
MSPQPDLTDVFERIYDAFIALDGEWRFTYVNKKAGEIFAKEPSTLIGQLIWDQFEEGSERPLYNTFRKAMKTQEHIHLEQFFPPFERWFEINVYPSPAALSVFFRDITARKKNDEQKALVVSIVNFSDDAIISKTLDGTVTSWNMGAARLFGYKNEEIIGQPVKKLIPTHLHSEEDSIIGKIAHGEVVYHYETERVRSDGTVFPVSLTVSPIKDTEGRINGASTILRDITMQKKSEQKILKANRLYNFLSSIDHMMVRTRDKLSLYHDICDIAVNVGQFRMAWIGLVDDSGDAVVPVVFAGEERGYLANIKRILTANVPEGRGPTGTAVREGRVIVCYDVETDPILAPWRSEALSRGYRSSIALPIRKFGKIIGVFTVYAAEKNFFDVEETALLTEAANDIGFALEVMDKEEQRKKAEEALAVSERRYQTLAEISPVGIFHADATGYTTYVNHAWCRMSGVSFEKAIGYGWLDAVHPEDKISLLRDWENTTREQRISIYEYRFVRPDGSITWVIGQVSPERDENDRIIGYVGTITDITERKKSEQEIIYANQLLERAEQQAGLGSWEFDLVRNTVRWSRQMFRIFGREQQSGPPTFEEFLSLVHEEDRHQIREAFIGMQKSEATVPKIFRTNPEKLPLKYFMPSWFAEKDSTGRTIKFSGTAFDITAQKESEEMLLREQKFTESFINSVPGILYLYDEEGNFLRWNWNFEIVSGYSPGEIAGMKPLDFFDRDEQELVGERIRRVFATGVSEVEAHFFTKSGQKIPYYFNGRRIVLDGRPSLIGMGIDISELKNARDALAERERRYRQTLDQMMEGVQIYDFNWYCVYTNDAAVRQGPYTREQILNRTLLENYPGIEHTELYGIFEECKTKRIARHIEYEFEFPDRSKKWFELSIQPNPEGLFILSMDISDRKLAEHQLQQAAEQLRRLTVHQQTALEEERKRISREIHDELGQQLTAIKMDIAWIDKKTQDPDSIIKSKLRNVIALLDGSNRSIRKILTELRMGVLDNHELAEALDAHGHQFTRLTGIPVQFRSDDTIRNVNEEVTACLYRAFQEALTNVTKYAEAKHVVSSLSRERDSIVLTIEDDGKGFDPNALQNKESFGILGMRERVASLQGEVVIESRPGKGTSIRISIPRVFPV